MHLFVYLSVAASIYFCSNHQSLWQKYVHLIYIYIHSRFWKFCSYIVYVILLIYLFVVLSVCLSAIDVLRTSCKLHRKKCTHQLCCQFHVWINSFPSFRPLHHFILGLKTWPIKFPRTTLQSYHGMEWCKSKSHFSKANSFWFAPFKTTQCIVTQ